MPVKPVLMADIRKNTPVSPSAAHRSNVGLGNYNRFDLLSPRRRFPSIGKRSLPPDDDSGPTPKTPRLDANKVFDMLKDHDATIAGAKDALGCAVTAIDAFFKKDDGGIGTAISKIATALDFIIKSNESLKSTLVDACKVGLPTTAAQGPSARPTKGNGFVFAAAAAKPHKPPPPKLTAEALENNRLKQVLREAERKTVIFDLDLGAAPTINKDSISRKVTIALHNKVQDGKHDWALNDAAHMLDDVLSCSQLEFLGSGTRKFFNNRNKADPRNGKICTVPVRMEFKNKDTRSQAEHTLRSICKVSCSVPYPKKLRDALRDMIAAGKAIKPECFIRTKVDIDNLSVTAFARGKEDTTWTKLDLDMKITPDFLDKGTVFSQSRQVPVVNENMESEETPVS